MDQERPYSFDVRISDQSALSYSGRGNCLTCGRSRKWFCYDCASFTTTFNGEKLAPKVYLPFYLHMLKYNFETPGKSTALHAAMLVKSDIKFQVYPDIPDYTNDSSLTPGSTWVLYPSKCAKTLDDVMRELCTEAESDSSTNSYQFSSYQEFCNFLGLETLVILDGTWSQIHWFLEDPRIKNAESVRYVKLNGYTTCFWRPQRKKPKSCLATIEALFYFLKEFQLLFVQYAESSVLEHFNHHEFDDILYFYDYMLRNLPT